MAFGDAAFGDAEPKMVAQKDVPKDMVAQKWLPKNGCPKMVAQKWLPKKMSPDSYVLFDGWALEPRTFGEIGVQQS